VSDDAYATSAWGVLTRIVSEDGLFKGLYQGFGLLLTRQIMFGAMKFLVFDYFAKAVYETLPFMDDNQVIVLFVRADAYEG
jgi:hypothetical protein